VRTTPPPERKVALFLFARDLFVHEVERNDPH